MRQSMGNLRYMLVCLLLLLLSVQMSCNGVNSRIGRKGHGI